MAQLDDGKIRLRCYGCGKRVKFPANQPGQPFRCPICHTTIVAPLDSSEIHKPSMRELQSAVSKPLPQRDGGGASPPSPSATSKATAPQRGRHPVDKVGLFMVQQTQRTTRSAIEVMGDTEISVEERTARLRELRRMKATRLREYVLTVMKDLDGQILSLRNSPASQTPSNKQNIADLQRQRDDLVLYLNVMFQLRAPGPSGGQGDSKPGTREAEGAPSSTP